MQFATGRHVSGESLFRDRVRERDLDNFLVEELHASDVFRDWLLARIEGVFAAPLAGTVRLGKSPQRLQDNRQTDVRVGWYDEEQQLTACILIESKVTADFQPGQAKSYAAELAQCRAALGERNASAVLVAPAAKLSLLAGREAFDDCIPIESIVDFLTTRINQDRLPAELRLRLEARVAMLEALCGKRAGAEWMPITIPEKRAFSDLYAHLASEVVPSLEVRASSDGPKAITKIFKGVQMPPGFPDFRIVHEFGSNVPTKYANIQFAGLSQLRDHLVQSGVLNGSDFFAEASGKTLSVRRPTPSIDPTAPFGPQREKVLEGLVAIRDLAAWLASNASRLMSVLQPEPTASALALIENASDDPRLESEMRKALLDIFRQCAELNYRPTGMLRLMDEHGPIGAVRRLISNPLSDGYSRLALLGRLDLAVERLALQERWSGVFSDAELSICRKRTE
jgi:hypothetical protein